MAKVLTLSSGQRNRYGYIIPIGNFRLDNYRKNPVLLAEHDYKKNVGFISDLTAGDKLRGVPNFASTEEALHYKKLYEEGAIRAISIGGFAKFNQDRTIAESFELFECSFVSVPADPGAVPEDGQQQNAVEEQDSLTFEAPESLSYVAKTLSTEGYQYVRLSIDFEQEEELTLQNDNNNDSQKLNLDEMDQNKPAAAPENAAPENLGVPAPEAAPTPAPAAAPAEPQALASKPGMPVFSGKVSLQGNVSLSVLRKDNTDAELLGMLENGTPEQKLNIYEAIKATPTGKMFMDKLTFRFSNGGTERVVSAEQYLKNKEALSSDLMANVQLGASQDFVDAPALDKIAFASLAFLKLFPNNRWVERMPVIPVENIVNGIGTIFVNVSFTSEVTTSRAGTNSSVTPATIAAKTDTAKSIAVWEHSLEPMLWRRYNRDIVAYDQMGYQWSVALQNMFTKQMDWDLFTLAYAINEIAGARFLTTGTNGTPGVLWGKIPSQATAYKQLAYADLLSLEAIFRSQAIDVDSLNPVFNLDPWMLKSIQSDSTLTSILTRWVTGNNIEGLSVSSSKIQSRPYFGVYNAAADAVLNPDTGTATSAMQQYGLGLVPEYVVRGFGGMEIYSRIDPTLYGEVYSAQIKSGITTAYSDAKGCAIIIPDTASV